MRYENKFDDATFIFNAEKLPFNLAYAIDNPKEKVHVLNNFFSQALKEHVPLKCIEVPYPPVPCHKTLNISSLQSEQDQSTEKEDS